MKQKHICIYTTPDVLEHKKHDGGYMYWELPNTPKLLKTYDEKFEKEMSDDEVFKTEPRLYFAIKGNIVGYFVISDWDIRTYGYCEINFDSDSWKDIKPIPQKAFQGFKYIERAE